MTHNKAQLLIILIVLISANISFAQENNMQKSENKKPDIVLYSNLGTTFLNYSNLQGFLNENNTDYPASAFNLGAGFYSTFGKIRLGMDFGSINGSSKNTQFITKHRGSFFSINVGYHILEKNRFIIAPVIGYSSLRSNVLVEDKQYTATSIFPNATSLTNNTNAIKFQLSVEKILKSGLFAGLSIGYDYSLNGDQIWQLSNKNNPNLLQDNMSNFYINLNIGTHLNFKKIRNHE